MQDYYFKMELSAFRWNKHADIGMHWEDKDVNCKYA